MASLRTAIGRQRIFVRNLLLSILPVLPRRTVVVATVAGLLLPCARSLGSPRASSHSLHAQVQLAVASLQHWYNPQTGLWNGTGWWNSANALTVLIDDSRATGSRAYDGVIARTWAAHAKGGFLNAYYDDEGWWALAWIDAYDLTGNTRYLDTASGIFRNMTGGWDNTCGGGLWWSKKRRYKNAIANELFLSVAAHLANRAGNASQRAQDLSWALREWAWFRRSGMIERDHLISDGLTPRCRDNHGRRWSYNQGVILGGLAELSRQPDEHADLRAARRIANAAIRHLTDHNGILHDPCEPRCGADGSQFKGIFLRNLAVLYRVQPRARWKRFILRNADSILASDRTPGHTFGLVWSGPPGAPDPATQSSALDALIAAMQIRQAAVGRDPSSQRRSVSGRT